MNIFTQFFKRTNEHDRRQQITQDIIRLESSVNKDIFGPPPAGVKRDFFCLDRSTWIWYEEWTENGQTHQMTTRYIIRPNEVLKSQNGGAYYRLSRDEFRNFKNAAEKYYATIKKELYQDFKEPVIA